MTAAPSNLGLDTRKYDVKELREIVARQKALGRRFLWLLIVPFLITAALVSVFFIFYTGVNARLFDVELLTKQLNIERYLLEDRDYQLAIDQYERIAEVNPNAPILARLGILYYQCDSNKVDMALRTLEIAKHLDPQYWEIYRNLSYIYAETGRTKEAVEAGLRALELNKNDAMSLNNLAWALATSEQPGLRNFELAEQYADKALALTTGGEKRAEVLDTIAEIYRQKSDLQHAIGYLQQAFESAPNWTRPRYQKRLEMLQKE
jgi:tetratricopeptide (TPR) repeat protein